MQRPDRSPQADGDSEDGRDRGQHLEAIDDGRKEIEMRQDDANQSNTPEAAAPTDKNSRAPTNLLDDGIDDTAVLVNALTRARLRTVEKKPVLPELAPAWRRSNAANGSASDQGPSAEVARCSATPMRCAAANCDERSMGHGYKVSVDTLVCRESSYADTKSARYSYQGSRPYGHRSTVSTTKGG